MGFEQNAIIVPGVAFLGLVTAACAPIEQTPKLLETLSEIRIVPELAANFKPEQELIVRGAINDYANTFGCPVQSILVDGKSLNDLSTKPDRVMLAQSVRGVITMDFDAFKYIASGISPDNPDKSMAEELERTLHHESAHACIAMEFINTQHEFVLHDGHVIYPFVGLTFQSFMPGDMIRPQNPIFEESVAQYLAYLLDGKQTTPGEPGYYRNIRELTGAVAGDNMDLAQDLARSLQYSDLIGFLSIIRGVPRNQLTINDFKTVLGWYEKAVLDETTDEDLEKIKTEMLDHRGQLTPASKDNIPLPANPPIPRKTPTLLALGFHTSLPMQIDIMSSADLKRYQAHLRVLIIVETDFLENLKDDDTTKNSPINKDVMIANTGWRLSLSNTLTRGIGQVLQQRSWKAAGIVV